VCNNCARRGISCGIKLPGPKTQPEFGPATMGQDRDPEKLREYTRLFEKFQQLRPDDAPEEIEKLIELVENGTLKETRDTFIVRGSDDSESDELGEKLSASQTNLLDWEPSSHNSASISNSEFEDGYFSVPGFLESSGIETFRFDFSVPKQCIPLSGTAPVPWLQQTMNVTGSFR
jgi:hypothetical protein